MNKIDSRIFICCQNDLNLEGEKDLKLLEKYAVKALTSVHTRLGACSFSSQTSILLTKVKDLL